MTVGVQVRYIGEELAIDLLSILMFLYITQVLPKFLVSNDFTLK